MIRYQHGEDAALGGVDITICLTPQEAAALRGDTSHLADWFDCLLYALTLLRTGRSTRTKVMTNVAGHPERDITLEDLHTLINSLDQGLPPRLQGTRDSLVRLHHHMGGTLNQLATAMGVSKSTAQSRRNVLTKAPRGIWETWAIKGAHRRAKP
ncbi:hypothetical protein ACIQJT_41490 [Streptomyces sp. NPDC091972]|uniref:hypothetical protein n=1 Tax=Streptomyces sp. NPDC091972 TaxID=3366007 RepID=UPI0038207426